MNMTTRIESGENLRGWSRIRSLATKAEGWWFDLTRHVETSGYVALEGLTLKGEAKSSFAYFPTRPSVARQALEQLPIQDYSQYTFVDLGSGMGRMLLLAAEYPFHKIEGVEFAEELHRKATQNVSSYRHAARRCKDIELIHSDVAEYHFPPGKFALYLFNPFGPEVLSKVFTNLGHSLAQNPRHVVMTILNPEHANVVDAVPYLRLFSQNRRFRIYQTEINSK
jgi:SAM-dependent methyltransferase